MKYELEQLKTVITDPDKLRQIERLPESILGLIVQSGLTESDFDQLRKYDIAYKARGLYRMKAVDYGSSIHQTWVKQEKKFRTNPNFIPYKKLLKNLATLDLAKKEEIHDHPHYLGNMGIEIIGAIPKKQNDVELLIAHNQIRWLPPAPGQWHEEMLELDSKDNDIPKEITRGTLKRYNPVENSLVLILSRSSGKSIEESQAYVRANKEVREQDTYFFTMPPLDKRSSYYDVVIPPWRV